MSCVSAIFLQEDPNFFIIIISLGVCETHVLGYQQVKSETRFELFVDPLN